IHGAILVAVFVIGPFLDALAAGLFDVAHSHELHVGFLEKTTEIIRAAVADTDGAEHDAFAWGGAAVLAQHGTANDLRRGQQRARLQGGLQKAAPIELKTSLSDSGNSV